MDENEVRKLMAEVSQELDKVLVQEKEKLSKAHPGEETSSEVPPDESATSSAPADDASDPGQSGPPADSAPPSDGPPADASASPPADPAASADPSADPAMDGQANDPAAIEAELAQMDPEHVKVLYMAAKKVLFAHMGGGMDPAASAAPPAASAGPPGASPDPAAPPAMKAEMNPANGGKVTTVGKSEKDLQIETLTKKVAEFEATLPGLVSVVEKMVSAPQRKAITSVTQVAGNKPAAPVSSLSKSEIESRLKKAVNTNLSKSDRELVNGFYFGSVKLEGISHILENVVK